MTTTQTVEECLRRAFLPTPQGIVGLTEQLLAACAGGDVEFERVGDRCVCRWTADGDTREVAVPLPPTAFRAILAQIARLCQERSPDSVTPYGGESLLAVNGDSSAVFRVDFVNTPEKQRLILRAADTNGWAKGPG